MKKSLGLFRTVKRFMIYRELQRISFKIAKLEDNDINYLVNRIKKKYALPYCENPDDARLIYESLFRSIGVVKILAKIL